MACKHGRTDTVLEVLAALSHELDASALISTKKSKSLSCSTSIFSFIKTHAITLLMLGFRASALKQSESKVSAATRIMDAFVKDDETTIKKVVTVIVLVAVN